MMPESAALSMWPADTVSLVPGFRTLLAGALAVLRADEGGGALGVLLFFVSSLFACRRLFTASSQPVLARGWERAPRALCGRVLRALIARAAAPTGEYPSTASRGTSLHARLIGSRYAVCNGLAAESACNTSSLKSSPRVPVLAPQHAHTPGINCISSLHRLLTRSVPLP